jgi:REP element-mobilizing transposase RayT
MAACPRAHIVRSGEVGVYHCWNRCVRRAFLCGHDPLTGKDFDYRRGWLQSQEQILARLFAVEIAFHAEMSNHVHLVLRSRPDVVEHWSDDEVVRRWLKITRLKRGQDKEPAEPTEAQLQEQLARQGRVAQLRRRLWSVSWFMGALCENIARRSNDEDRCRGKFWESRYGCRDLADEAAILVAGIYVDLNPIRAGEAQRPDEACHSSAYDRCGWMTT